MRNTVLYTCKRTGKSWRIADEARRIAGNVPPITIPASGDRTKFEREIWLLERRIRMAITAAVRKERERCVGIVQQSRGTGEMGKYERAYMCDAIIDAIRKGKA